MSSTLGELRASSASAGSHPRADGPVRVSVTLGLAEFEVHVFEAFVRSGGGCCEDVAAELGVEPYEIAAAAQRLLDLGLLISSPWGAEEFLVVPPAMAMDRLAAERELELMRLREYGRAVGAHFQPARASDAARVQVVEGREFATCVVGELLACANEELLVFHKPPYMLGDPPAGAFREVSAALARGVAVRAVYDQAALESDGNLAWIAGVSTEGEDSRVVPELPFKLIIADRRMAWLAFGSAEDGVEGSLLVEQPSLVRGFVLTFELISDVAVPFPRDTQIDLMSLKSAPTMEDRQMLSLMASGLKDAAIGYRLGLSSRTVARRIASLMRRLGAQNRFQAGYLAARRGWL